MWEVYCSCTCSCSCSCSCSCYCYCYCYCYRYKRRLEQEELARMDVALGDEAAPADAVVFDQPDWSCV